MLSPPSAKKLSSMPTRGRCSSSRNSAQSTASCALRGARCDCAQPSSGSGSARRSSLPFGVSGSAASCNDGRRHHVVRQLPRQRSTKSGGVQSGIQAGARDSHHIADQPPHPGRVLAHHHRGLRHAILPRQRRLDLARLDPEAAQLDLRVRPTQEVQHSMTVRILAPPRQVPGAVHPRPRSTMRIGHEPLRRQARTVAVAPRQTPAPAM